MTARLKRKSGAGRSSIGRAPHREQTSWCRVAGTGKVPGRLETSACPLWPHSHHASVLRTPRARSKNHPEGDADEVLPKHKTGHIACYVHGQAKMLARKVRPG